MRQQLRLFATVVIGAVLTGACAARADDAAPATSKIRFDGGWPQKIQAGDDQISVYQPQLEKWDHNQLSSRAAVAVQTKAAPQPTFGVIWVSGRTDVDKENRTVALEDLKITKASFPTATDKGDAYLAVLRQNLPPKVQNISLDRLEANLAITQAEAGKPQTEIKNDVPQVFFSSKPAVLVLIDGKPALRKVDGVDLLRVINTRALILLDQGAGKYYLNLADRWLSSAALDGNWSLVTDVPAALETARKAIAANQKIDSLDDLDPDLKDALTKGAAPIVYVSTTPAELLQTQGDAQFQPIDGTQLLYVKNTSDQIILDLTNQNYFVVMSGRWFKARVLTGPWDYVPYDKVPADVAKIPTTHPKGDLLAAVPGTPQAKEAAIANSVPQTATIKRSEAKLTPVYDGDPQFTPIEGTTLSYAANSPTPIIQVNPTSYYAVENGVWFTSPAAVGPWVAATLVPPAIYSIPLSCPINYVTNVRIYNATPEYVYCGYTPGYFGTCLAPAGCVVYGTGWRYTPWIGNYWYGRAWSYGFGAHVGWTAAGGWGFGFGVGACRPWWGPVGWGAGWGGAWRGGWERGWGGGYANTHINNINFNNFNAYNRWGNNTFVNNRYGNTHIGDTNVNIGNRVGNTTNVGNRVGNTNIGNTTNINRNTQINSQRNNYVSSRVNNTAVGNRVGNNNVFAGNDGNVYRRNETGWETNHAEGWRSAETTRGFEANRSSFEHENWSRYAGEQHYSGFRSAGSFGGYRAGGGGGVRRR